jgi:hypothetical protein
MNENTGVCQHVITSQRAIAFTVHAVSLRINPLAPELFLKILAHPVFKM